MVFHLCKTRRGSNPDAVVNCNNAAGGPGGVSTASQSDLDRAAEDACKGPLSIQICPTTGGLFNMDIASTETVEGLRRTVAKKLGVTQERISLLYKDRLLKTGSMKENQLCDGSRVTLLPHVEAGLMSPHPEVTVMQALENLSESQVHDFLAGKSPLTLAMKLGKHMMFLQLQLSTVTPGSKRGHVNSNSKPNPPKARHPPHQSPNTLTVPLQPHMAPRTASPNLCPEGLPRVPSPSIPSIVTPPPSPKSPNTQTTLSSPYTYPVMPCPMVTSQAPAMTSLKDAPYDNTNTPPPSPCYLHKPIPTVAVSDSTEHVHAMSTSTSDSREPNNSISSNNISSNPRTLPCKPGGESGRTAPRIPLLDNSTFAEAKRSLSMTLEQFSKKAAMEQRAKEMRQAGAVIDTMQRLGHGVYSGTFSGTLNPALQDTEGKPRKSINTIVHILNDLLGASHPRPCGNPAWARMPQKPPNKDDTGAHKDKGEDCNRQQEEEKMTRDKVERIQMRLEEKKRRRQARRKARASPYPISDSHVTHAMAGAALETMETTCGTTEQVEKEAEDRAHAEEMEQDSFTPV